MAYCCPTTSTGQLSRRSRREVPQTAKVVFYQVRWNYLGSFVGQDLLRVILHCLRIKIKLIISFLYIPGSMYSNFSKMIESMLKIRIWIFKILSTFVHYRKSYKCFLLKGSIFIFCYLRLIPCYLKWNPFAILLILCLLSFILLFKSYKGQH